MTTAVLAGLCSPACRAARPPETAAGVSRGPGELHPGEIRRSLVAGQPATGLPGWETRLYLIEYGPGAAAPVHVHPAVGVGQVLEGSFESAFGDAQPVQVHAGEGFVDQPAVAHRVFRNLNSDRPLRFLVAYTIHPNEPTFYPGGSLPPAQ